jgi:hypothetical protein
MATHTNFMELMNSVERYFSDILMVIILKYNGIV